MTRTRDQAVADSAVDPVDVAGRCRAEHCPNVWTTSSSRLCRWHSAAPARDWHAVSRELQHRVTDAALERQNAEPPASVSLEQKREILAKLRRLFVSRPPVLPKAWAHALQAREEGGERLSNVQRTMWRQALGRIEQPDVLDEIPTPESLFA